MSRVADALQRSRTVAGGEGHWPPLQGPGPMASARAWSLLGLSPGRQGSEVVADPRLVTCPASDMVAREQYRRLAASLHQAHLEHNLRTMIVTSALPREGKTLTAVNLALTLSVSYGRQVLLIDADLRQPSVHTLLRIDNTSGLTDTLASERPLSLAHVLPNLWVLPAGPPCADPLGKLTSAEARHVIDEAHDLFDWVVIDTPPVGLLPDASVVAAMVEATVLVVAAGRTPYAEVQRATETIGAARLFGMVLNRVSADVGDLHSGYYRSYAQPRREGPVASARGPEQPKHASGGPG